MKKLYDWLTVWEKHTTTDKVRAHNTQPSSKDANGGKRRRLKMVRRTQNILHYPPSSESVVDISDVQLFDNNREI